MSDQGNFPIDQSNQIFDNYAIINNQAKSNQNPLEDNYFGKMNLKLNLKAEPYTECIIRYYF